MDKDLDYKKELEGKLGQEDIGPVVIHLAEVISKAKFSQG